MPNKNFIIGAGLSGISASYFLRNFENTIIEKDDRLNGRIRSFSLDNTTIEIGAQFFSRKDKDIYSLVQEVCSEEELKKVNLPSLSIVHKDRTLKLDERITNELTRNEVKELKRFYSFLEEKDEEFFQSPPRRFFSDTFREWYEEDIGGETIWFIKSLVRSITFSEPKELSAFYGIVASLAFFEPAFSIAGGLERLNKKILSESGADVMKNHEVSDFMIKNNRIKELELETKESIKVDGENSVISSVPSKVLVEFLPSSDFRDALEKIEYKGCGVTLLKTSELDLGQSSGFLYPQSDGVSALINENRYFGFGSDNNFLLALRPYENSEDKIFEKTIEEIKTLKPGLEGNIIDTEYFEWDYSLPVASPKFFRAQENIFRLNDIENLFLCGDYIGLPSLDACARSAKSVREKINS